MAQRFELRGARALVTGATGGLGQAISRALRDKGAELVVTGRRVDVLETVAKELDARSVVADLGSAEEVDRLMDAAGDIDVLVANAALPGSGPLSEYTPEQIERTLMVNLQAPILLARAAAEQMRARGRGHIVMIGSLAGIAASPGSSMYNATKFGLRGFTLALRQDLRETGIGVSIVEPGFVREAGMFVEGGGQLPRGVRTVAPTDVAAGVVSAIERDRAEVIVAPVELRIGASIGSLFPRLSAAIQHRAGGEKVAQSLTEGQRHMR